MRPIRHIFIEDMGGEGRMHLTRGCKIDFVGNVKVQKIEIDTVGNMTITVMQAIKVTRTPDLTSVEVEE
jgi:hypothetical protein